MPSQYTPDYLRTVELFRKGSEPTEVSNRFDTLSSPTNGNAIINGSSINLSWKAINNPDAIDDIKLQTYFNENYKSWAEKYYQERISYNAGNIGTLGYQVYLENADGSLTSLGFTPNTSFTYVAPSAANYKFIIKSSYSIFKSNMSNGLSITANLTSTSTSETPSPTEKEDESSTTPEETKPANSDTTNTTQKPNTQTN